MGKTYKVKPGDTLAKIARRHGYKNWRTIYDHADNADFKTKRPNPNLIFPGDQIVLPEKQRKEVSGSDQTRHRFQHRSDELWLRIMLHDTDDQPLKNMDYTLKVGGQELTGKTNGEGLLEHKIPETAETGVLHVGRWALPLKIGHLDPAEEESGWTSRLHNLGYAPGVAGESVRSAVEEFQVDQALKVDGVSGPVTQEKLTKVHGC